MIDINKEANEWARSQFSSDPDDYEELYYLGLEHGYKAGHKSKATQVKVLQAQIDFITNEIDSINWDIRKIYVEELQQQLKQLENGNKI